MWGEEGGGTECQRQAGTSSVSARFKEALLQLNNNKQRRQHCKVDTHSQSQVGVNLGGSSICGSKVDMQLRT